MAIRVSWGHMEPPLRGGEVVGVSDMTPFERAMVVSYRLSIVTIALFVTIRPQFAIECFLHFPKNMGFHYPLSIIHMPQHTRMAIYPQRVIRYSIHIMFGSRV